MHIAVFDTETTGLLNPSSTDMKKQPYITEINVTVIDENFKLVREFDEMIRPPVPLSDKITQITGLTDKMLKDKKIWKNLLLNKLQDVFKQMSLWK